MQSILSGIWTRVAVSISYDDNDYITTSKYQNTVIADIILNSETLSYIRVSMYFLYITQDEKNKFFLSFLDCLENNLIFKFTVS